MSRGRNTWKVLKFGGTSVATAARWERIHGIVTDRIGGGARPLLVLSAVSGVSNALEALLETADEGGDTEPPLGALAARHTELGRALGVEVDDLVAQACGDIRRELADAESPVAPSRRARITAWGEWLSTKIGVRWLRDRGLDAAWVDARELLRALPPEEGASPGHHYLEARCGEAPDEACRGRLEDFDAEVVVTQGFLASDAEGDTVLLGRGGSDTAAAVLAAKIGAAGCEIWTDVAGLFSADPRVVPDARHIPAVSYDEAESLAGFGGKVLHPRSVHPVRVAGIPLDVRCTDRPEHPGTRVNGASSSEGPKAVVSRTTICMITMHKPAGWKPIGFLADVSACFKRHALPVDLVASSPSRIRLTLDLQAPGSRDNLPALLRDLGEIAAVELAEDVASVSVVGHHVHASLEGLDTVLEGLGGRRLLMTSHCASDLSVTWVVPEDRAPSIVRLLHETLFAEENREENDAQAIRPVGMTA